MADMHKISADMYESWLKFRWIVGGA